MYHRWCLSYAALQILRYFAPQFVTGKRVNTHPDSQYGVRNTYFDAGEQSLIKSMLRPWKPSTIPAPFERATIRKAPQTLSNFSPDLHDHSIKFTEFWPQPSNVV
ncbi:hypothetical protein BofuT4_P057930.1 [Botrytis cinerea T4]|uniref:Uncharacterized protein n=1 Tax=Botryotinia fuckeliana (strain T4) TaxID=999810 RepID=G2XUP3_BOTF4|nr:hypothetical protein BofuT4_P057930.1 [Botrytis cinerea T4]